MWVIVAVVLLIWYFTARGRKLEKRQRLALRRFNYARPIADRVRRDWVADFVDMVLVINGYDSNGVPESCEPTSYLLRRHEGQWQMRMSDSSRRTEAARLDREIKKGAGGSVLAASRIEDQKKALADLDEPKWVAIDGEVAGPLESQYQRFIAHYRES
jgi:hypothetical protein